MRDTEKGAQDLSAPRLIVDKSALNEKTRAIFDELKDATIQENGAILSCDNVRLTLQFKSEDDCSRLNEMMMTVQCDDIPIHFQGNKPNNYRELYSFKISESSVTVGLFFTDYSQKIHPKGFIEFNPNKVGDDIRLQMLFNRIVRHTKEVSLKRWDLACDIETRRDNVRLMKDGRGYEYVDKNHGVTEYLGDRNKPGRVKVYDKSKEREYRNSPIQGHWTRIELTCDGDWSVNEIMSKFPVVTAWNDSGEQDETRRWVIALGTALATIVEKTDEPVEPYMKMIGASSRAKVEAFLTSPAVVLESESVQKVYNQAIGYVEQLN